MNICKNCRHSDMRGPIWYSQFCRAPEVQRKEVVCPQTGEKGYAASNDLGRSVIDDRASPYCRDINPSGLCPHYESR